MSPKNHLRVAREQAHLTLEAASAHLARSSIELSPGQLSRLERGESSPSETRLRQLGRLYGWSPGELLGGRTDDDGRPRPQMVPLIDTVQAGAWTEVADPYPAGQGHAWLPVWGSVGPRAFALTIDGDSMRDEFQPGDVIVVDPDLPASPGRFVVAKIDDQERTTFKRYREKRADRKGSPIVELVPLNPDWPILTLDSHTPGHIVGVAVRHYRSLV